MKIYLLRHSESTSNQSQMADSQLDVDLSPKGQVEAVHLSKKLAEIKPDIFIVSPLKRTRQTIQPYLNTLDNPKVEESRLLLERDLGDFTGTPMGTFQKYCDDNKLDRITTRPPNGESLMDVYAKAKEMLVYLKSNYADKVVLVCGSKNNLMCLQIAIEGKSMADYETFPVFTPAELRELEF